MSDSRSDSTSEGFPAAPSNRAPAGISDLSVDLRGTRALVTGAARRSGRALALAFARAGADVAVHYRSSREEAAAVAREIEAHGVHAALLQADLSDADETRASFEAAIARLGGLDILVNNVGTIIWKKLEEHTAEDWQTCLNGTLIATRNASVAALPALRSSGRGRIINILDADADATSPVPFATAYKLGKRASFDLTKTLAVTEAERGITVNAVSPGTLEDSEKKPPLERIPAGRYGTYADLESAVLFLASRAAGYVNGVQLKVSGAYLI